MTPHTDYPYALMQDLYPEDPLTWDDAKEMKIQIARLRAKASWRDSHGLYAKATLASEAADRLQVILDVQITPRIKGTFK